VIDLDAYFTRIGYTGPREPNLETLRTIHLRHVTSIPFENLNPLLQRPVKLDVQSLERKLIHEGRGGYCFEQNLTLVNVLRQLGFKARELLARVRWTVPDEVTTPLTHMLLLVETEGAPYIADVGFGGQTLTTPISLVADLEQPTAHETYRLLKQGDEWLLQALLAGEWRDLYRFDLAQHFPVDYEVGNWYTSTHPDSHFTKELALSRADTGRRYMLRNNQFAVRHVDAPTERRILGSRDEIKEVISSIFHLQLPEAPELDRVFERLSGQ
jgi:N-hydroxyarylamine O-acetyltransferase